MNFQPSIIGEIQSWVVARGLAGGSEADLLAGFCIKCREAGLLLSHSVVIIDTLHPTYEGRAFRWQVKPTNESPLIERGAVSGVRGAGGPGEEGPDVGSGLRYSSA